MKDQNGSFEALKVYSARDYEGDESADPGAAGAALVEHARAYALAHPGVKFREALNAVTAAGEGAAMLRAYNENANGRTRRPRASRPPDRRLAAHEASEEVDRQARQYSEQHQTTYRAAVAEVLRNDPELAAAWAGRRSA